MSHRLNNRRLGRIGCGVLPMLLGIASSAMGDSTASQQELQQLQRNIGSLQQSLQKDSKRHDTKAEEVEALERKIAILDRRLLESREALASVQKKQQKLLTERHALQARSEAARTALAGMLRAAYEMGRQPYLKMLLNQVEPGRITRTTTYFQYLAAARTERLQEMAATVEALRANGAALENEAAELQRITGELNRDQEQVAAYQASRAEELAEIRQTMSDKAQQISGLQAREQRLRKLLAKLQKEAAERRKREQQRLTEARLAAEREANAEATRQAAQRKRVEQGRATATADSGERPALKSQSAAGSTANQITPQGVKQPPAAITAAESTVPVAGGFGRNRGRLPLPVKAPVAARFGERKPESGLVWEGVMFAVQAGQAVQAVYPGEVVYSDWLRGYGQLLVVDHGEGYMSLYGHNQLLHKGEGERVEARELVANAGATGGLERPGLLFEIRHNGEPRDPLQWARK